MTIVSNDGVKSDARGVMISHHDASEFDTYVTAILELGKKSPNSSTKITHSIVRVVCDESHDSANSVLQGAYAAEQGPCERVISMAICIPFRDSLLADINTRGSSFISQAKL